jgi:hypothetical protein
MMITLYAFESCVFITWEGIDCCFLVFAMGIVQQVLGTESSSFVSHEMRGVLCN